jgi:uncharacterized protein (TIGR00369 family)
MQADLLVAREALRRQGFSQLLGAELDALAPGTAEISLPLREALRQHDGYVHGGVLAYLADNALAFAGSTVLGKVLTAEFKINYMRPVLDGERLVAVATVVGSGRTQAVCRCEIFLETASQRKVCAAAQGTIHRIEA